MARRCRSCLRNAVPVLALVLVVACGAGGGKTRSMEVTASAYTLRAEETAADSVGIGAWGDRLNPGMNVIAVSRDLIGEGLDHGTRVRIEGFREPYVVRDKMNRRFTRKIDILMADVETARRWGRRTVTIHWVESPD